MVNRLPHNLRIGLLTAALFLLAAVPALAQSFMATGSYTGDGNLAQAITEVGFQPDVVIVSTEMNYGSYCKTSTMGPGMSKSLGVNDALQFGRIIALNPDGFTVGGAVETNENGGLYYYIALRAVPGVMEVGSYTGWGIPDMFIGPMPDMPVGVFVMGDVTELAVFRSDAMAAYECYPLRGENPLNNSVLWHWGDGFTVGTDATVNSPGTEYHYIAWFETPEAVTRSAYLGDGVDNRDVTGVGFAPGWVMTRGNDNQDGVHASASVPGGMTHYFQNRGDDANGIQSLGADGFQVGTRAEVNSSGVTYYWLALADPDAANDLQVGLTADPARPNVGEPVTYTVTVTNTGTTLMDGIVITGTLAAGLTPDSDTPDQGTYDPGTGVWDVGSLGVGASVSLEVVALVDPGRGGQTLDHTVALTTSTPPDGNGLNNAATAPITVQSADVVMTLVASDTTATEDDLVVHTVVATNAGPDSVTALVVDVRQDAGLLLEAFNPSRGSFDDVSGAWSVGTLPVGMTATLTLVSRVAAGTVGTTLTIDATAAARDQEDPQPANDVATAALTVVPGAEADLQLAMVADDPAPPQGSIVTFTLTLRNDGPGDATGVMVLDQLPTGLNFVSATPTSGTYDQVSGRWTIGPLANGATAVLQLSARVVAGVEGTTVTNSAFASADQGDPDPSDNTAAVGLDIPGDPADDVIALVPTPGAQNGAVPGTDTQRVLAFTLINRGSAPDTVRSLTISNLTGGMGSPTQADLDAEWLPLKVWAWGYRDPIPIYMNPVPDDVFVDGRATFPDLEWALAPGEDLQVVVSGGPSLRARDAALLRAGIAATTDCVVHQTVVLEGGAPLVSGDDLLVDGFAARQASLREVDERRLAVGSQRNLVLDVLLPANGYRDDVLYGLNLVNRGSAAPGVDIARMEAWVDTGDDVFSALDDALLGDLIYSGDRWQLTGLAVPMPVGGRRIYVTLDVAETAQPARDVRLGLPLEHGPGAIMVSGNDGPVDESLESTGSLGISVSDRVILTTDWVPPAVAHPGAGALPLLTLVLTNTYSTEQTLQTLVVRNATTGAGGATTAELDAVVPQLVLRLDGNGDGILDDQDTDPALGVGTFIDGVATFSSIDVPLSPVAPARVFVTGGIGLQTAAEGDVVGAKVDSNADVVIPGATAVAPRWPLDSGAAWTVDGLVAAQLALVPVPVQSLGPGEGPALALDLTVPDNGYRDDELIGIEVANAGSAVNADFDRVRLWTDGGDGAFDAGAGDDTALADLTWAGDAWSSPLLSETVGAAGRRFFVSVDVAMAPTDSATVRFAVPLGGIRMASGNSGPLDEEVADPGTLVLTISPLRSALAFVAPATVVGQASQISMGVRNTGTETLTGITPSTLVPAGTAGLTIGSPTPASFDLPAGQAASFVWDFTADTPGVVTVAGFAQGTGQVSLNVFGSAPVSSPQHTVHTVPTQATLYPVVNLPGSVNKGQTGLVPLTLTLVNPGDETAADILVTDLRLRLTETDGGVVIVPEDLVERIAVAEGTNVYAALDTLPATPVDIDLHFDPPARVTSIEPISLGIRLDLKLSTSVPSFVLSIEAADWFSAGDAVNGTPVPLVLAQGTFPIRTNQANLASPAGSLLVELIDGPAHATVPEETDVPLTAFAVTNEATEATASAIQLTRVALVLRDDTGTAVTTPLASFSELVLSTAYQEHFRGLPQVLADSVLVVDLTTPAIIAAEATVTLDLVADIADDAQPLTLVPVLGDIDLFSGLDANDGLPVPVNAGVVQVGAPLVILGDPDDLAASGLGRFPATLAEGSQQADALDLTLSHGGDPDDAAVAVTGLVLTMLDGARQPLDPALVFSRIRVHDGSGYCGDVVDPAAPDGRLAVPLSSVAVAPGEAPTFTVKVDVIAGASGAVECVLAATDIALENSVSGEPLDVAPNGGVWPLSSGVVQVVVPAEELAAAGESLMPPLLAPRDEPYQVLALSLRNPASPGEGGIALNSLTVGQPAGGLDLGSVAGVVQLTADGTVLAKATDLDPAARTVTLDLDPPLVVAAAQQVDLELAVGLADDAPTGSLVLQVTEDDVDSGPEGGTPGDIRVVPESGQAFPFVTKTGNVNKADLAASYLNFPNPFAAGREATTFAFSLTRPGRVSLRILTPHGEQVVSLVQGEARAANLYQQDQWTGRNGKGHTVRNGVYLAELVVEFDDGTRQRVLRKVAVVR